MHGVKYNSTKIANHVIYIKYECFIKCKLKTTFSYYVAIESCQ